MLQSFDQTSYMRSHGKHIRIKHAKSIEEKLTLRNSCNMNIYVSFSYVYSVHDECSQYVEVVSVVDVSDEYAVSTARCKIYEVS
jgi:hypothetical protein